MKKAILLCCIIQCCSTLVLSQKHDYNWIFGYSMPVGAFGNAIMNFSTNPPTATYQELGLTFTDYAMTYSDSLGELQVISDGLHIYDAQGNIMEYGDTINPGDIWHTSVNSYTSYLGLTGGFCLPRPKSDLIYYFHYSTIIENQSFYANNQYYTEINPKTKRVRLKNQKLIDSQHISLASATKHGNGRDWWIVNAIQDSNLYYIWLLDSTGVSLHHTQVIGDIYPLPEYIAVGGFSNDGSLFLRHDSHNGLHILDFDRCSGTLSQERFIPTSSLRGPHPYIGTFSPDDRFLYLNRGDGVWSLDLESNDWIASFDTVARWEATFCPEYPWNNSYYFTNIGPDGKIYASSLITKECLNVVHRPNRPSYAADSEEGAFPLPVFNASTMHRFPNYRLGVLKDSPCDTLATASENKAFEHPVYTPPKEVVSEATSYLKPLPALACPGCTEQDLDYLNRMDLPNLIQLEKAGQLKLPKLPEFEGWRVLQQVERPLKKE